MGWRYLNHSGSKFLHINSGSQYRTIWNWIPAAKAQTHVSLEKFDHASRTSIFWASSLLHHFHILPLLARFSFVGFKTAQGIPKRFFLVQQLVCQWKFWGNLRFLPCKKSWLKREFIETSKPQAGRRCYSVKLFAITGSCFLQKRPTAVGKLEKTKPSSYSFCGFRKVKVKKNPLETTGPKMWQSLWAYWEKDCRQRLLRSPAKKKTGHLILSFLSHPMIP